MRRTRPLLLLLLLALFVLSGCQSDCLEDAQQRGWLFVILAAFGFGFLTSLTPCVYPMIPITLAIFGARGKDVPRKRAISLAAAYVGGMGLTYATLGVTFAMIGKAGSFGTQLASPYVVIPLVDPVHRARGVDVRRVRAQPAGGLAGQAQPDRRQGLRRRVRDGPRRRPDRGAVHRPVPRGLLLYVSTTATWSAAARCCSSTRSAWACCSSSSPRSRSRCRRAARGWTASSRSAASACCSRRSTS